MSTDFDSRLTARAASVLMAMLDHVPGMQPSFAALLHRKLSHSRICFGSDMPPGVVTLNSQVLYTVDCELAGPHLIVSSEGHDFPDYARPPRKGRTISDRSACPHVIPSLGPLRQSS